MSHDSEEKRDRTMSLIPACTMTTDEIKLKPESRTSSIKSFFKNKIFGRARRPKGNLQSDTGSISSSQPDMPINENILKVEKENDYKCDTIDSSKVLNQNISLTITSSFTSSCESIMPAELDHLPCKICLSLYSCENAAVELDLCGCKFCIDCLSKYIEQCIENCNVLPIQCPDSKCSLKGHLSPDEVKDILTRSSDQHVLLLNKYQHMCENIEILRDPTRTHCPNPTCQSVCSVDREADHLDHARVLCEKCNHEFCSKCFKNWPNSRSDENNNHRTYCSCLTKDPTSLTRSKTQKSTKRGSDYDEKSSPSPIESNRQTNERQKLIESTSSLSDLKNIKRCPRCTIPIERAEGCAQIMCKFCRHTFCFYCLESLENDFMLKHYTKSGPCKGKLGHSRVSLFFHRLSVIAIFSGTIVIMILLSPFILLTLPCLIFSDKCRKTCFKFSSKLGS